MGISAHQKAVDALIARQALIRINESGKIRTYENLNVTRRK
jgi:hypothetical protein